MSDPNNKQGLEDFFHQYLDQYEEDPGDGFWENLEDQIPPPPPRKRRRLLLWWLTGLGLLGLMLSYIIYNQRQLQELEEVIYAQQEQLEALDTPNASDTKTTNREPASKVATEAKEMVTAKVPTIETQINTTAKAMNSIAPVTTQPPINTTQQLRPTVATVPAPSDTPDTQVTSTEEVSISNTTEEAVPPRNSLNTLQPLASKAIFAARRTLDDEATQSIELPKFTPLFDIGVFYEYWLWTKVRGVDAEPLSLTGNSQGLHLDFYLRPRWRLQTGLGWTNIEMQTVGQAVLAYQEEGAELAGAFLLNDYDYSFTTVLGDTRYNSAIGFSLESDPLSNYEEGETFNLEVRQTDRLGYLHLPLYLFFESSNTKRWQWTLGAGLDLHQLLNVTITSATTSANNESAAQVSVRSSVVNISSHQANLRSTLLGARAMAGVQWSLVKRWQLGLQGYYYYGLTPINQPRPLENSPDLVLGQNRSLHHAGVRVSTQFQF